MLPSYGATTPQVGWRKKSSALSTAHIVAICAASALVCMIAVISNLGEGETDETVLMQVDYFPTSLAQYDFRNAPNEPTKTWDQMWNVCASKGMVLCKASEICNLQSRQPLDDSLNMFGAQDNWIAVGDASNEWLTFGNPSMASRKCKTHTEVAGSRPGWGTNANPGGWNRAAKCCPRKYDYISVPDQATKTWSQMQSFCYSRNQVVCKASEICNLQSREPVDNAYNIFGSQDNWIAVGDSDNEWLTFGNPSMANRKCKTHTEVAGAKPGWGGNANPGGWNRAVKCCPATYDFFNIPNTATKTWEQMRDVCASKGMDMCKASDICNLQSRQPIDASLNNFADQDNWIAVGDSDNEWLTFGTPSMANRKCKTHTEVAGAKPGWGTNANPGGWNRAVKCCAKKAVVQTAPKYDFINNPNTPTKTWAQMQDVCKQKNKVLCKASDICNLQSRQLLDPSSDVFANQDNWIAVGDSDNEWLTFGTPSMANRKCKTHTEVAGGKPGWGTNANPGGWYRAARCCNPPVTSNGGGGGGSNVGNQGTVTTGGGQSSGGGVVSSGGGGASSGGVTIGGGGTGGGFVVSGGGGSSSQRDSDYGDDYGAGTSESTVPWWPDCGNTQMCGNGYGLKRVPKGSPMYPACQNIETEYFVDPEDPDLQFHMNFRCKNYDGEVPRDWRNRDDRFCCCQCTGDLVDWGYSDVAR